MSGHNQFNQWGSSHLPATNDIPATSHSLTAQQYGAPATLYQSRIVDTSTTHGQIHAPQLSPSSVPHLKAQHLTGNATSHDHTRGRQPVVSPTLNVPHPTEGLDHRSPTSEHQPWILGDSGNGEHLSGQPPIYNNVVPSSQRRPSHGPPDASPKCRIPDCTYNAYYDYSEQEQTEYCGQGHELQAISTGLVASCVMCRGRPRRTGERVCSRTCGERDRQARQVQGSYYGVPVVRRESRTRPGA